MPKPQRAQISVRPATQDDCRRLWDWRNESTTRAASFNSDFIPYQDHENWFSRKMRAQDTRIFIVMDADAREVGYVRFSIEADEAEISVGVDIAERGKGYGADAIRMASDQILATGPVDRILAYIKQDNPASLAAFQRAGFDSKSIKDVSGIAAHVMTYRRCP